ncbi:DUF192 domain-containing protein [Glaciecola sp. 2405UD65-10]|uniref:DUF192 domain-containing protein n=1 Tax=Glaciecola sp. 2405UD65-10 TaxID=3397244 RepID=UPI003B5D04B9
MLPIQNLLKCFLALALMFSYVHSSVSQSAPAPSTEKLNASQSLEAAKDEGKIEIKMGGKLFKVAYADDALERQLGLMYRRKMCDDCGMLFKFDSVRIGSIWMKNTYIPLDLAYITEAGEIVDIKALTPHDLTPVKSSSPVLYALEMNQAWFAQQGIKVGDKIERLP